MPIQCLCKNLVSLVPQEIRHLVSEALGAYGRCAASFSLGLIVETISKSNSEFEKVLYQFLSRVF